MSFKIDPIDYSKTGYFSDIILDYLSGNEKLKPFYDLAPGLNSFSAAIESEQKQKINRTLLVEELLSQYSALHLSSESEVLRNIKSLSSPDCFTVTTGHQLCLFTGPLYFIYKIFSAINLAGELRKAYPEFHFVPVYWMHTEDHDIDEIRSINVFGKKLRWDTKETGPAGFLSTHGIDKVIVELKNILPANENSSRLLSLFEKSYSEKNLAAATRILIHELFGKYGLVALDPSTRGLKNIFTDVAKEEITHSVSFRLVNETNTLLEKNHKPQVNPREINLFYVGKGSRERIVKHGDEIKILNEEKKTHLNEFLKHIEEHPETISPNVVLRGVYQEMILPNIAYVGGGAEIAYWLQFKKLFEHYYISMPVLVLRSSVLWIDAASSKKISELGFIPDDIFLPEDELVTKFISSQNDAGYDFAKEKEALKSVFEKIKELAEATDKTLSASVNGEEQKTLKSLEALEEKFNRALKRKNETTIQRIKSLKERLFPGKDMQERIENFSALYARLGEAFFVALKEHLNSLNKKFIVFTEAQ